MEQPLPDMRRSEWSVYCSDYSGAQNTPGTCLSAEGGAGVGPFLAPDLHQQQMYPLSTSRPPAPCPPRLGRWMEGLWCYDRHTSIHHVFVAKHTKFPLSHSALVSLSSHPVLSCRKLHSAANGSKWALAAPSLSHCSTTHLLLGY